MICAPLLFSQELYNPFLEEEAPPTLFETEIGDAEVDLFAIGSWTAGWGTSFGFAIHPPLPASGERITAPYPYPGFAKRSFYQLVDLTLSLWLYERYFFETTFLDDFAFNSLLLGYQGKEGELVQYVVAGNSTLSISEYPYLNMGRATENVPGVAAKFQTASTTHELLLRVESTVPDATVFSGMNALDEERIEPSDYIRGRFFVLPDGNIDNLTLYIEDEDGTVLEEGAGFRRRRYRKLDLPSEASYSLADGTVALREPAEGQLLAYYEKGGVPVGDGTLGDAALVPDDPTEGHPSDGALEKFEFSVTTYYGRPLTDWGVEISDLPGSQNALVLYTPGDYNPFEQLNRYAVDGVGAEDQIRLLKRGTSEEADSFEELTLTPAPSGEYIAVGSAGAGPREVENRYPFARPDPESGALPQERKLYGPGAAGVIASSNVQIGVQRLSPVESITLAERTVPGTVSVLRNGVPLGGVAIDYDTGEVSLPGTVLPGDRIELRYRRYTEDQQYGDLLFASGNRIAFSDYLTGEVALGGRWNISGSDYSAEQGENPGSLTLSSALTYETDNLSAGVDGALQLYQPDTTGYLRIDGMDNRIQELPIVPERLLPGSAPRPSTLDEERDGGGDDVGALAAFGGDADGLSPANRGKLLYKDYSETTTFGAELIREYDASLSSSDRYAYEPDSRRGPYTATAAGDGIDGRVAVADFELDNGEWEAILAAPGGALDLRNSPELSFSYSLRPTVDGAGPDQDIQVWLQIGYLSEDSDADGTLDRGDSGVQPLYTFNDSANGFSLYAGDSRATVDRPVTEDLDGNGILDHGSRQQFVSFPLATTPGELPVNSWKRETISLSPEERSRLGRTTGVRLVILGPPSGGPSVGRLLLSGLELYGSSYLPEAGAPAAGSAVSVREGPDPLTGGDALRSRYATVREIFLREGAEQRVLELSWQNVASGDFARAYRPTTPVYRSDYRQLRFYAYLAGLTNPASPALRLTLSEAAPTTAAGPPPGAHLSAEIDLSSPPGSSLADGWAEITVDTVNGDIRVNGVPAGEAEVSGGSLQELRYTTIEVTGAEGGTLYVDEVHFAEPQVRLDGATSGFVRWQRPGTILTAGAFPVIADFEVAQRVTLRSRQFSGAPTAGSEAGTFVSATSSGVTVAGVRLEGDATTSVAEGAVSGEGGHRVTLPAADSPVVFTDTFRRTFYRQVPLLGRSNSLLLSTDALGSHQVRNEAQLDRTRLRQEWSLSSETPSPRRFTLESDLALYQTAGGYTLEETDYATSWIGAYPLLLRWEEGRQEERRGEAAFRGRLGAERRALILEPGAEYARFASEEMESDASLRATGEWRGGAPGAPEWRIAPYYERRVTTRDDAVESATFGEDLGEAGGQLSRIGYALSAIPGWELFLPVEDSPFGGESQPLTEAGYSPTVGIGVERPFGSRITDLYYPASLEFSLSRSYQRESDALRDLQDWNLSTTAAAINLFGRQGAYPRFDIYLSDEIRNTLSVGLNRDITAGEITQNYALESKLALFGEGERVLNYRQRLATQIAEETSYTIESESSYTWQTVPLTIFGIDRLANVIEEGAYYRHTIRGEASLEAAEEWTLTTLVGHETSLEIPETGSIRAYLDLGWTTEPFSEGSGERQHLFGLLLGVEGTLSF